MPAFLRRLLFLVIAIISLGCWGSRKNTSLEGAQLVKPRDLYDSYTEGKEAYTDVPIRVALPAGSYTMSGELVTWNHARDTEPPSIVFHFDTPQEKRQGLINITGICRGKVIDRRARQSGKDWHVKIDSCQFLEAKN